MRNVTMPKDCNHNKGCKPSKAAMPAKNKPMGEKMTMKGKDKKMGTNNYGEIYQK
jgi:hypothetical protein